MRIIPQNKLDKWVLPSVPRHKKKSGKKNWMVKVNISTSFGILNINRGYETRDRAEKALESLVKKGYGGSVVKKV